MHMPDAHALWSHIQLCFKNSKLMSKHSRTWTETRWQSSSIHNVSTSYTLTCFDTWIFSKYLTSRKLHELVCTVLQSLIYVLLQSVFTFVGQRCLFSILMMFHVFHLSFRSPRSSSTWLKTRLPYLEMIWRVCLPGRWIQSRKHAITQVIVKLSPLDLISLRLQKTISPFDFAISQYSHTHFSCWWMWVF